MPHNLPLPTAFLDRDGVINVDYGYVHTTNKLTWIDGALSAIAHLKSKGYLVIVVTNQAGVGRGFYDETTLNDFHRHIAQQALDNGGEIDAFYYCPFHKDAVVEKYRHPDHPDRKPNPGMILRAMTDWPVNRDKSFLIGDKDSDIQAAQAAGITGHKFKGGNLDIFVRNITETQRSA